MKSTIIIILQPKLFIIILLYQGLVQIKTLFVLNNYNFSLSQFSMKPKKQIKVQVVEQPTIPSITRQQKVAQFLQKAQNQITVMIDTDKIKFPTKKIPYNISQVKESGESQVIAEKLKTIQMNKQKMQYKLKTISQQQRGLQMKQRQVEKRTGQSRITQNAQSPWAIRQKSQLKAQDIVLLKRLKHQYKQFENNLELKTKAYEQAMSNMKKQQQQLFQRRIKEQNEAKRKQITKKLEQLAARKKQKQNNYQQEKKKMLQIKTKKKLYEQLQQKHKNFQKQQLQKKVQQMQQRFEGRNVKFQDLKEHAQKYRQMRQKWKEERLKKQQQHEQVEKQRKEQIRSREKSKYYTILLKEKDVQKTEEQKKQKRKFQLIQSGKQYAQIVKRQHVPKVKQQEQLIKPQKIQGLSFQQQKEIGNSYLQFAKRMLKKRQGNNTSLGKGHSTQFNEKSKQSQLSNRDLTIKVDSTTNSLKYRDYLSERRTNKVPREKVNVYDGSKQIKNSYIRRELQDVNKIMNSAGNKQQKLQQIKYITKKIEQKDNKQDYMLDKISAKLKILQTLSNYQ